jgi:hypothetical protein
VHHTFEIDKQQLDYFYISYNDYEIQPSDVTIKQDILLYFMTAFKVERENGMLNVSLVYHCNPIFKGISDMSMVISLPKCGNVRITWKKSCGDFSFPPYGLNLSINIPKSIEDKKDPNDLSFTEKQSKHIKHQNL